MNFLSDNAVPASPEIMRALEVANVGGASGYGDDQWTEAVEARMRELFSEDVSTFLMATGTAANAIALASVVPSYAAVFCHRESHVETDECGAAEFYTGGAKLALVEGDHAKMTPDTLEAAYGGFNRGVHSAQPRALSLTQSTELGTVYSLDELAAICDWAKSHDLITHMDGARFANACVSLGTSAKAMTKDVGIDILTFGATKNGALAAEAVVFLRSELAESFPYHRKQAGHLISKMRYVAAQFLAYLTDDLWLQNARHANSCAQRIAEALPERLMHRVEANEVFLRLSDQEKATLRSDGAQFYDWGDADSDEARFVASWATTDNEVDQLSACLRKLGG
ncbi:MAG: low specificity L-threonine aldolase [Pseudomonadota bacterium]